MANLFSHPAFVPSGSYTLVGYNLVKSAGTANGPNYFGPYNPVPGYSSYTANLDIVDTAGTKWDLYRVQPIINTASSGQITLDFSRPFFAFQPLYDMQISSLLDSYRRNWIDDIGIYMTDSTIISESTGAGTMPFITDANTSRFYTAFLPNADPIKFRSEYTLVFMGQDKSTASPLIPYTDFYPNGDRGFVDFAINPPANNYLKIEYTSVRYSDDECRNMILNAVSDLSNYGINGYQVNTSNNLNYLAGPLVTNDLGELVCHIARTRLMASKAMSSFEAAESWKDGKMEYTADPSRSIQAATLWLNNEKEVIRNKANNYILNSRSYLSRGEFDSFFETTGVLPVYTLFISNFNMYGYWL